ncbi:MAG: SRPBCC family protein [Opitutales bacterium]
MKTSLVLLALLSLSAVALPGLTAASAPSEGSAPQFTSHYRHNDRKVDQLNIDQLTVAPLQIVMMARVNLPPEQTFDLVSRQLPQWVSQIPHVAWDNTHSAAAGQCGSGSVRQCAFGHDQIVENIRFWQEGRLYAYSIDPEKSTASFPIRNHLGVFIVESDGQGGSLVTWRQYFNRKFSLMAPMAGFGMRHVMKPALAKLVEQHGGELVTPDI